MTIETSLPTHRPLAFRVVRLVALLLACFYVFLLSLELVKGSARSLGGWLHLEGNMLTPRAALGTGWATACVVLSGSPVAAIALGLLESSVLDELGCFSMIIGSRLGASFVVLVVGLVYDLQARRERAGVYVGALALITTATVYIPAFFLGYWLLDSGWLADLRLGAPAKLHSLLEVVMGPAVAWLRDVLPEWGEAILGIGLLVGSFKVFDGFLPAVDPTGGKVSRMATTIYRPWITFVFGMLVTCLTLSVSVSLTLLVPLTVRGIVRRENLIPYILGANITTFVDTLVASVFLKNPAGFTVVLSAALSVTALTLPIVFLAYRPYERFVDGLTRSATRSRMRLLAFVVLLFATAIGLVVI